MYVPCSSESPLTILPSAKSDQHSDTFLIPQWGGVVLYNDNTTSDPGHVDVKMERVMSVFVRQLKLLLGIPSEVRGGVVGVVKFSHVIESLYSYPLLMK